MEEIIEYPEYGLKTNPFTPILAERRDPDLVLIVGSEHKACLKRVVEIVASAIRRNIFQFIVIRGIRGSGKTTLVVKLKEYVRAEFKRVYILECNLDIRVDFPMLLSLMIKKILHELRKY